MPRGGVVDSGALGYGRTFDFELAEVCGTRPRVRAVGAEWERWKTVALSMFNNIAGSCVAFVFGVLSRWLWFG